MVLYWLGRMIDIFSFWGLIFVWSGLRDFFVDYGFVGFFMRGIIERRSDGQWGGGVAAMESRRYFGRFTW
ncbi:Protein of unknown function [Pyronema omphalodes CBS 100304]|uniref:Uncharacterized protein n=1 Tax=Pyronema omphalodes (strain CBS 100304) TaxID=1076935 RepID=U4L0M8_PYROM|nr:Protein of unknown function [Pyronema omphalodes CBS 100304]